MIVDRQFSASHDDWPRLRDAVLEAEADGVGTAWILDHLDGRVLGGDRDMLECFTLLGALSSVTTSIGLGTLVMNVTNRHPAVAALAVSSVQRISGGRLILGIGAGADPAMPWASEHHERGIPVLPTLEARHAAVVHQIEHLRRVEPTRVVVGVNSLTLARLAGEHADALAREHVPDVAVEVLVACKQQPPARRERHARHAARDGLVPERLQLLVRADVKQRARRVVRARG